MSMAENTIYITEAEIGTLIGQKTSPDAIIFLSGPTSLKTPLSVLKANDVITVNGSARYLLDNGVAPFIYVLTDSRFLIQRRDDFYEFSKSSRFTIVNRDVYEDASEEDKRYLEQHCFIIRPLYKREKGGVFKKLSLHWQASRNPHIHVRVPLSKRKRLVGFSTRISDGYCSCHTIAFTALQIAYSLHYERIVFSGLDLTGACTRFYDESNNPMPSELSKDLGKILPFFAFAQEVVGDLNVYNLSEDTAVDYRIIPHITPDVLSGYIPA